MFSSEVLVRGERCRREAPRSRSSIDTNVRSAAMRSPCRIIDISRGGARLRLYQELDPETSIQLVLPAKGLVDAHIVWANGHEAGCRFDQPLDEPTVVRLKATATERGGG